MENEKIENKKVKNETLHNIVLVTVIISISFTWVYFFGEKQQETIPKTGTVIKTDSLNFKEIALEECSNDEIKSFFNEFIVAFNSQKAKNIDTFIDKDKGYLSFYYDGVYPILDFSKSVENNLEWYKDTISESITDEKFPEYLGEFQYSKRGFFYSKINNKFKIEQFENSKSNHTKEDLNSHKNLESNCNYTAKAMNNIGNRDFTFYFSIYKTQKKLVAITYEYNNDADYCDPKISSIAFSNEEAKKYLKTNLHFCDKGNDGRVDFEKNEITYVDFDKPFQFKNYKIDKEIVISKKISIREVHFYNIDQSDDYNKEFSLIFTNKGTFYKGSIGARAPYYYTKCN